MTLLQQGAQSCDVRGGHRSAAQKVEQAAAIADGRNPGEDVHRRGREVGLEDVTTRGPARARRRKGGEERSGNGSGDVAGQFRRRRAAARIDVRLDRRAVRASHVHGGHVVKKVGAHDGGELDVSQDHARSARLLDREALVDGHDAKGPIAQDDLAGRLRGIEVADEAACDTSREWRSIRWSRIGRGADGARVHQRKHRGARGERRAREGAAVPEADGTAEEAVVRARRDGSDPRTRAGDRRELERRKDVASGSGDKHA